MPRFLSVLPEAGGTVPPTPETLREPARRGPEVSVLGHRQVGPAAGSAGLRDPGDLDAPAGVEVRRFGPDEAILPYARLVTGHGGPGTTMRALAHGALVPDG